MGMKPLWTGLCWIASLSVLSHEAEAGTRGVVRLEGRTLCDANGPFLGLGATYMQALRHCKFDCSRLHKELTFLASCGFDYVRVLSMVDWPGQEITPVDHANKNGQSIKAWDDYDQQLAKLVDIVHSYGLRTQITLFADAQWIIPDVEARRRHVLRVLSVLQGREEKVILYEVANEGWQNGFPGNAGTAMIRTLGEEVANHSVSLLALTSPPDAGNREEALRALHAGSPANVATFHFSRDLRTGARSWLPVMDCWTLSQATGLPPISSNEPIGPGASVASEDDPEMVVSAAAFAYLAGLPMYVFHSAAGVTAEHSFESMPWLCAMKSLKLLLPPDLPNWERFDSSGNVSPLKPEDRNLDSRYNCGARKGTEFVMLALDLGAGGRTYRANAGASFTASALVPARVVAQDRVAPADRLTIRAPSRVCFIKGRIQP